MFEKRVGHPPDLPSTRTSRRSAHSSGILGVLFERNLEVSLAAHAPGLTPRAVLEKLASIQMLDVSFPTTDGRCLTLPRYTEPADDVALLLHQLKLTLPNQPPPRIAALSSESSPPMKM